MKYLRSDAVGRRYYPSVVQQGTAAGQFLRQESRLYDGCLKQEKEKETTI